MSDYIKREDAIKAISKCCKSDYWQTDTIYRGDAEDAIETLPSADVVERKHGEWINVYCGEVWVEQYCSECGVVIEDEPMDYNFCPNCGADMRERKDNE